MKTYILKPHLTRKITIMDKNDERVPSELFSVKSIAPDLSNFPYPLPSPKSDYTCFAEADSGVVWYGGKGGVTRYDKNAERGDDIIMYFGPHRHLASDSADALLPQGDGLWVLGGDKVTHIEMIMLTCEQRDALLREETDKYVMRRGMVSQMDLKEARNPETRFGYTACDNDGLFTSCHSVGELFRYATLRREKGADHPETLSARAAATKACEACLLLMYIHGREEGFISRSYHVTGEPLPDDGIFYKRNGDTAACVETSESKKTGRAGEVIPCTHPIPDRLARLYRDLGYTENDITYKADTSSDEVSGHFLQMRFAHDILGPDDPELDALIKDACSRTTKHIIDGGFEFLEHSGKPTTWARWSKRYFENEETGYVDAPLNAAEMLMLLKVTMRITGESGFWQETYDNLIAEGYAELAPKHFDRFFQGSTNDKMTPAENTMYGDHMLALITFWMLTDLESDEKLLELYRGGFKSWKGIYLREHNPGYDFPYLLSCPDEEIDLEKDISWLYRMEATRLSASVNLRRHDVPIKHTRHGSEELPEISTLLMPDERYIRKYDHNPFHLIPEVNTGTRLEGSYVYTFAYWIGRYYGFIAEEE